MKKYLAISFFCACSLFFAGKGVRAEAVPASRCVTAATRATHAAVIAQMEKDISPYAAQAGAAASIQKYREGMMIAWQALEQPYCGFGSYGASSAIKSYTKSITRTRAAFLEQVKKSPRLQVASMPVPMAAPAPKKEERRVEGGIVSGLHRGLRADAIKLLQNALAEFFGLPADDSLVTGFFGPKTEALVIKFQLKKKIIDSENDPGAGLVGPKTSRALNSL